MSSGCPATDLRRDALACFRAALRAVEPERLVREFLEHRADLLAHGGRIALASVGKAAASMARGAVSMVGSTFSGGAVIVPPGESDNVPGGLQVFVGGHPIPSAEGVRGAVAVRELAQASKAGDLFLLLISGGGSALMTLPPEGVSLDDLRVTTRELLRAGAEIGELNAVRKHLDELKGGQLAREAHPARVVALVLSDVVGDPLDVIASGPVSPDPTSFDEAIAVLDKFGLWAGSPEAIRDHLEAGAGGKVPETPDAEDPCFRSVEAAIVGDNSMAAEAARLEAQRLGYAASTTSTTVTGEAREIGGGLGRLAVRVRQAGEPVASPACMVSAGETTVTVTGSGRGGRNQEVALGAAVELDGTEDVLVAAFGTDGIDGPTDAAGAIATGTTVARARELGLDPRSALADNDAYSFFEALGDLVVTGPTGTNVMDLHLVMVGARP